MCIFIVLCSVFLNWVCWVRGNFSGEPGHVHIRVCESPLCGVPGRYEYIWALWWCGRRDCTDFLVSLALFWRVRYDWNGEGVGLCFSFYFLQFVVSSLGGWICAVGILRYIFCGIFVVVSCGFLYTSCWLLTIYYRWFRRSQHLEEDQEPLLERMRLEHQRADLGVKTDTFKLVSLYIGEVFPFWTMVPRKRLCLLRSVVWTVKSSSSRLSWLLWTASCPITKQFLESKRRVSVLICGVLFCSFSHSVLCDLCFEVFFVFFSEFLREYAVLMKCWRFHFVSFNKITDFHFDFSFHFYLWRFLFGILMCCLFSFFLLLIRLW